MVLAPAVIHGVRKVHWRGLLDTIQSKFGLTVYCRDIEIPNLPADSSADNPIAMPSLVTLPR